MKKIKVLIVEDSLVYQTLLNGILKSDLDFEVVAIAENGLKAIEYIDKYKPDVVSMDISMPIMDGVEATRTIMSSNPLPIVIVSGMYNSSDIEFAIEELEAGALAVIPKPIGPGDPNFEKSSRNYRKTLKLMSEIKVIRRTRFSKLGISIKKSQVVTTDTSLKAISLKAKIVAIGSSAGGPEALRTLLSNIKANFPLPILIAQHIDQNFVDGFANWLRSFSKLPVNIAVDGEKPKTGNVYIASKGKHILINTNGTICLKEDMTGISHKPSVDLLFKSVGKAYGGNSIAIILSGMGRDGALELKTLKDMGAYTIAQDQKSCLVFGMPGEAIKLDAANKILSPEKIICELNKIFI